MVDICRTLRVGDPAPDFTIKTYEPSRGDFGEASLEELRKKRKWTILFFYPAAFTFV
jgi:peroxiredoxin (alkyl hydroperoxide reductase subunit C)